MRRTGNGSDLGAHGGRWMKNARAGRSREGDSKARFARRDQIIKWAGCFGKQYVRYLLYNSICKNYEHQHNLACCVFLLLGKHYISFEAPSIYINPILAIMNSYYINSKY